MQRAHEPEPLWSYTATDFIAQTCHCTYGAMVCYAAMAQRNAQAVATVWRIRVLGWDLLLVWATELPGLATVAL